jgi:hypothetical protein
VGTEGSAPPAQAPKALRRNAFSFPEFRKKPEKTPPRRTGAVFRFLQAIPSRFCNCADTVDASVEAAEAVLAAAVVAAVGAPVNGSVDVAEVRLSVNGESVVESVSVLSRPLPPPWPPWPPRTCIWGMGLTLGVEPIVVIYGFLAVVVLRISKGCAKWGVLSRTGVRVGVLTGGRASPMNRLPQKTFPSVV